MCKAMSQPRIETLYAHVKQSVQSSQVISHYAILGNRGNAYGRNGSSSRNRSLVTKGAPGKEGRSAKSSTPWHRPVEGREVTHGLS